MLTYAHCYVRFSFSLLEEESKGLWSFMRKTKKIRHKPDKGGIYLDDLNLDDMDPEVAALYFPQRCIRIKYEMRLYYLPLHKLIYRSTKLIDVIL